MVNPDFRNSISVDKFCAGYAKGKTCFGTHFPLSFSNLHCRSLTRYFSSGAGARPGDSGGGLMFKERNSGMYFVRGIVSNKDSVTGEDESSIATFTDVSVYTNWIFNVRQEVENQALTSQSGYDGQGQDSSGPLNTRMKT